MFHQIPSGSLPGDPLQNFRDGNHFLVIEILEGVSQEGRVENVDKLSDGIRSVTTRIYRASCALINGFWPLIRLMMLFVVAVLTLSLYFAPAMFLAQRKAMLW